MTETLEVINYDLMVDEFIVVFYDKEYTIPASFFPALVNNEEDDPNDCVDRTYTLQTP